MKKINKKKTRGPIIGWILLFIGSLLIGFGTRDNTILMGIAIPIMIVSYDLCFNEKWK